jgi:hypothetical protein
MTDRPATLNLYLGPKLKADWQSYCARIGKKPGAALREAIESQVSKGQGGELPPTNLPPKKQKLESPDTGQKLRLELRLTPTEHAAICEFAAAAECSPQHWIVAVIRSALTRTPQFGLTEWKALGESNHQLLRIGRNVNQIAKHLNEQAKSRRPEPVNEDKLSDAITALRREIKRHTAKVDAALRANVDRWSLE